MTYTSLLTQCARLGQADRAGVVLDQLNKRRTNATAHTSSSGNGGVTGNSNPIGNATGNVDGNATGNGNLIGSATGGSDGGGNAIENDDGDGISNGGATRNRVAKVAASSAGEGEGGGRKQADTNAIVRSRSSRAGSDAPERVALKTRFGVSGRAGIATAGTSATALGEVAAAEVAGRDGAAAAEEKGAAASMAGAAAAVARGEGGGGGGFELGKGRTAEAAREEWNTDTVGVGGGSWKMDRKLENDLLKLFGQADQVDAAFKVRRKGKGDENRTDGKKPRGGRGGVVVVVDAPRFVLFTQQMSDSSASRSSSGSNCGSSNSSRSSRSCNSSSNGSRSCSSCSSSSSRNNGSNTRLITYLASRSPRLSAAHRRRRRPALKLVFA